MNRFLYIILLPWAVVFNFAASVFYRWIEPGMHADRSGLISRHSIVASDLIEWIILEGCEAYTEPGSRMAEDPLF